MKTNITGTIDPKAHREYFLKEFKKRFGHLTYKEDAEQKGKEEQIILMIQSPSENLGSLRVFLSKYEITISFPKISFHSHFDLINSIGHIAPDADASIPTRINALDFIKKIIDDRVSIRCYKRKERFESATVIDSSAGKPQESLSSLSRPFKSLFLTYEKEDYYWSGKQTSED
ncbi:MAG: hypothetical protein H6Q54_2067 [Deltaproteobacteria bacterium]|jgi:hypothetical protein|nr:hypothetical protein [Deltaproteobacteria bacterium]